MRVRKECRSKRTIATAGFAIIGLVWFIAAGVACGQSGAEAGKGEGPMEKKPIEDVLKEHTDSLMSLPGVVGTAQGECSGEPCIRVLVVEKTAELLEQIPPEIEGYTVDVLETGVIRPLDSG